MAKLLYICPFIPYPLNNGGNQAFFMMADHIRKQYELSVLLYVHHHQEYEYVQELKKLWPNVTFYLYDEETEKGIVQENPELDAYAGMSWKDRKLCELYDYLGSSMHRKTIRRHRKYDLAAVSFIFEEDDFKPSDIVRNNSTLFMHTSDLTPAFCSYVQKVSAQGFDIVQVEFYEYLPLVYILPKEVKKVFVHHELRFVRNENELQLFKYPLPTDSIRFAEEKSAELAALSIYDAVVTLTPIDKNILEKYLPAEKVFVSPAITQAASYEYKPFKAASELVFVGSGNHFPNADGLVWFCTEVLPLLSTNEAQAPTVYITGQWKENIKNTLVQHFPTIRFIGYVDDLQSFLNGKISIVPIRIGSGMRMKILDSVFASAPIITTSKGCEGLPVENGENCMIADSAEDFAQAISSVLSDVQLQERLATNAQNAKPDMLDEQHLFALRKQVYDQFQAGGSF